MPLSTYTADTELPQTGENQRRYPRHPYPCKQRIAYDNRLARFEHLDFNLVQFYDISREGFSFLIRGLPRGDLIVAEVGQKPNLMYVRAKVAHVSPIQIEGTWMMLVGCHVTGRVQSETQPDPRLSDHINPRSLTGG